MTRKTLTARPADAPRGRTTDRTKTDPPQERGERIETAKAIHRGGKTSGHVPVGEDHEEAE
jgi:hypothetical protein